MSRGARLQHSFCFRNSPLQLQVYFYGVPYSANNAWNSSRWYSALPPVTLYCSLAVRRSFVCVVCPGQEIFLHYDNQFEGGRATPKQKRKLVPPLSGPRLYICSSIALVSTSIYGYVTLLVLDRVCVEVKVTRRDRAAL